MNHNLKHFCLLTSAFCLCAGGADAAVRVGNNSRSYAGAYQQVMAMQQQAAYDSQQTPAAAAENLPVRVANNDLAERIVRGDASADVSMDNLESCSMIYPGGNFAWDRPTGGNNVNHPAMCVAVVELRHYVDGINDPVLARANIAAGDAVNCNISDFPETSYTNDVGNVTFPADRAPTMDDVIKVMNDEQKKNAGFKIAAGTIIGGIGGNLLSDKNSATGKKDAGGTLIGALAGAGLAAGNSYAGKVGGDMILSAGVNAAAGGAIGNMVGSGESVLRIEDCKDLIGGLTKCLWGTLEKHKTLTGDEVGFYNISDHKTVVCHTGAEKSNDVLLTNCKEERLIGFKFTKHYSSEEEGITDQGFLKSRGDTDLQYTFDRENADPAKKNTMSKGYSGDKDGIWVPIADGGRPSERVAAMISNVNDLDKTFGAKMADWYKWRTNHSNGSANILGRDNKGVASKLTEPKPGEAWTLQDFYPLTVDASDGGIIDINNKARLKSTMIGAGAGAGLGAFTAYQGAQDEIDLRWVSEMQVYKDSLTKFYCATGTRWLSQYNEAAIIPNMNQ
jgi:hypothetical protein